MAWSYDTSLKRPKDQVRFLLQDTNTAKQLFQDEEIDWVVGQAMNIYMAAAELCEGMLLRTRGLKSKKISEFAISFQLDTYTSLAAQLRARGMGHQQPYAGGISVADKATLQADVDAIWPNIVRNLDRNDTAPLPAVPSTNPLTTV